LLIEILRATRAVLCSKDAPFRSEAFSGECTAFYIRPTSGIIGCREERFSSYKYTGSIPLVLTETLITEVSLFGFNPKSWRYVPRSFGPRLPHCVGPSQRSGGLYHLVRFYYVADMLYRKSGVIDPCKLKALRFYDLSPTLVTRRFSTASLRKNFLILKNGNYLGFATRHLLFLCLVTHLLFPVSQPRSRSEAN
jgi:hypothetical protein